MRRQNSVKLEKLDRLCIVTQFYPPDFAATGQLIEELATYLGQQGTRVKVFTGQPGYAYRKDSAPTVETIGKVAVRRSRAARFWPQKVRGKAVNGLLFCIRSGLHLLRHARHRDVLLLTTAPPYLPVLGYLANLLFGVPYVCLLYDLYPDVAVQLGVVSAKHWLTWLWDAINSWTWQNASAVIVLSDTMEKRVLAKCPEIAGKISVVHNWADLNWIVPIPKQQNWFAQKYNLTEKFTVLYSGNIGRCHDMDTILEAAYHLQDEPIQFIFIGDGAKRQACMDKVTTLDLKNCLFLPYQDKQILPYSLTACDLSLVSISPNMEGIVAPSKFYGMLAAGRPVAAICEKHSYLRQIIARAHCGEAFEHGDWVGMVQFIRQQASDPELVEKMGQSGRSYMISNFTLEIAAKQYLDILYHVGLLKLNIDDSRDGITEKPGVADSVLLEAHN